MKTKFLAAMLSLSMMVSLLPASAIAVSASPEPETAVNTEELPPVPERKEEELNPIPEEAVSGEEFPAEEEAGAQLLAAPTELVRVMWNNAPVIVSGQQYSFVPDEYNDDVQALQYWLAVNITQQDQALRLEFSNLPSNTTLSVSIFDSAGLETSYPDSLEDYSISGADSVSYCLESGTYYVLIRPPYRDSGNKGTCYVTPTILNGDHNESNNTWEEAKDLIWEQPNSFSLHGDNDVDWFKITTTVPGDAIRLDFYDFDYTVPGFCVKLYSGAELLSNSSAAPLASINNGYPVTKDTVWSYKANEPGDYYLKLYMSEYGSDFFTKPIHVIFDTIEADALECNDTYEQATVLDDSVERSFTFNGGNDVDWFYFETTVPNELVELNFSGFETDYSSYISYYIYDATENGCESRHLKYENIDRVTNTSCVFTKPGGHYIKVEPYNWRDITTPLSLVIHSRGGTDTSEEPNDTWQEAKELLYSREQEFSLPKTSDNDWFKFTTDAADYTLILTSNQVPSGTSVFYQVYSGRDLQAVGADRANPLFSAERLDTGREVNRHMLEKQDTYYIRVYAGRGTFALNEKATIKYELVGADSYEANNVWKDAKVIDPEVDAVFTMPAENDIDWFKFPVNEPDQTVEITMSNVPASSTIYLDVYAMQDFIREGDNARYIYCTSFSAGVQTRYFMLGEADTYYFKLTTNNPVDGTPELFYRLLPPDSNECNNVRRDATYLREGVDTKFTLPAPNDVDWFTFDVNEPNMTMDLKISNVPEKKYVEYELYSLSDFEQDGDNAYCIDRGSLSGGEAHFYHMFKDIDTYYLALDPEYTSRDTSFRENAVVRYDLIAPDRHEWNNDFKSAADLEPGRLTRFALPADNDNDFFRLTQELPVGDKVSVTVGDMTDQGASFYVRLQTLRPGYTELIEDDYATISGGKETAVKTLTVKYEGVHYLKFCNYNSARGHNDADMYMQYRVGREGTPVTGLRIMDHDSVLAVGVPLILNIEISPFYASDQSVTWASSDETVATVDKNGKVTPLSPGSTVITVTPTDGGSKFAQSCELTVVSAVAPTGVVITQNRFEQENAEYLAQNRGLQLKASVQPSDATDKRVTWASSDETVLSVTRNGKVFGVGPGVAKITVTTVEGGFTDETWLRVPGDTVDVRAITLNPANLTVYMGEEPVKLTASVKPGNASNQNVTWESENPEIAAVDENGQITAVSEGETYIVARSVDKPRIAARCYISVQPPRKRVEDIRFDRDVLNLGLYATHQLRPIITPEDATDQTVNWTTSNKTVASVSRSGIVTTIGIGWTDITASCADGGGEHSAVIRIIVGPNAELGDVNNDGVIDVVDAMFVLRYSVGLLDLTDPQLVLADVNGDNFVDAADAILILRYSVELITKFPASSQS